MSGNALAAGERQRAVNPTPAASAVPLTNLKQVPLAPVPPGNLLHPSVSW